MEAFFIALMAAVVLLAGYASLVALRKLFRADPGVGTRAGNRSSSGADNRAGS